MTVSIGNFFKDQYRLKKVSNLQRIIFMKKSKHWLTKKCCKNRKIRSATEFSPSVNWQVLSKTWKFFSIVQILEKHITYYITVSILLLVVWDNLPGSPRLKFRSIMPEKLHWSTELHSRNGYV